MATSDDFVTIIHVATGAEGAVPEESVDLWLSRGYVLKPGADDPDLSTLRAMLISLYQSVLGDAQRATDAALRAEAAYQEGSLDGKSAYEIAVENGFVGTEAEWLESLKAQMKGDPGDSAYQLAVANGFAGTQQEWLASLVSTVPGPSGGDSAYTIAVQNGYVGTVQEWLASLIGPKGDQGFSAYEVAVLDGFVGTETEWLASLQGDPGTGGTGGTGGGVVFYDPATDAYPTLNPGSIFVGPFPPVDVSGLFVYMTLAELGGGTTTPDPTDPTEPVPEPSTDLFVDAFAGAAGAAWDPAKWTAGVVNGGAAVQNGDGTAKITRGTGPYGIRLATPINQDHELLVPFRFGVVDPWTSLRVFMRGTVTMNAARGYSVEPKAGTSTFEFQRVGTETAETTGGTDKYAFGVPFPFVTDVRYMLRMATVTQPDRVLVRVKLWPAMEPEPAGWTAVFSDATEGRLTSHRYDGITVDAGATGLTWQFAQVRAINPSTTSTNPTPVAIAPPVAPTEPTPDPVEPTTGPWGSEDLGFLSGASGQSTLTNNFANWRGRKLGIIGTWNDSKDAQTAQWSLENYNFWEGNVDNAFGAIYGSETWGAAANGAYDSRWITGLKKANSLRAGKPGRMYLRFAHEFNLGYDWKVSAGEEADFIRAWRRFHGLFRTHCDARHRLVWSPNWDTVNAANATNSWPGDAYVDVIGIDYYNQWPYVSTYDAWWANANSTESGGHPKGIETWRKFGLAHGVPVALSEWGDKAFDGGSGSGGGDNPGFMKFMWDWFNLHSPDPGKDAGPGQVAYDIYFNVEGFGQDQFVIYPFTHMPRAAASYAANWKKV